jgi:hypothetical protein
MFGCVRPETAFNPASNSLGSFSRRWGFLCRDKGKKTEIFVLP